MSRSNEDNWTIIRIEIIASDLPNFLSTNIFKILEELSGQKVKYTGTIFIPFPQEKFIFSRKKKDFAVKKNMNRKSDE